MCCPALPSPLLSLEPPVLKENLPPVVTSSRLGYEAQPEFDNPSPVVACRNICVAANHVCSTCEFVCPLMLREALVAGSQ